MKQAADSSVTIAALLSDHPAHEGAADALAACETTIAHVAAETYSVLTRLPTPNRPDAATVVDALTKRLPPTYATLDAGDFASAPGRLAAAGVSGGATYDGLIALTALEHDLELVSRDRRAARSYRTLGVRFKLLT
ncbi:MAG TPA: PIN domain-containing protein [Solirubrobacteraceae bacterium]